jgi:hypothetical protein
MLTEKPKKKKNASWDTQVNPLGHGMVTNKIRRSSIFSTVSPRAPVKINRDPVVLYVHHCTKLYALQYAKLVLKPCEILRLILSAQKLTFLYTMASY